MEEEPHIFLPRSKSYRAPSPENDSEQIQTQISEIQYRRVVVSRNRQVIKQPDKATLGLEHLQLGAARFARAPSPEPDNALFN